ncbi:MAG: hypothetical protein GX201_10875 [Clostridiales bacterium]|nr:hypothetical protein [Clostridiales bacterium]
MIRRIINRLGGNRFTLISIIMILGMILLARITMPPRNDLVPTERIVYLDNPYIYKETISDSPFKFIRGKEGSQEGFKVLLMRKDRKASVPEEVYIYIGNKKYMKYLLAIDTK